jgi:hypothetical protein
MLLVPHGNEKKKHQAPPGIATGGAGGASTIVLASVISAAEFSLNCSKHKH